MGTSAPTPSSFGQYLHEARFQYSDCLDDQKIRLLELKFGHTDEVVHLNVQTYPADDHPPYIALSYTWGDPNDTVNVLCNGKSIAITRNLKEALWQFRENRKRLTRLQSSATSRGQLLHFWIDAICIDQKCDKEKSFQVGMMAKIYKNARHVFTWLGRADKSSEIAIRCIDTFGKMAEDCGTELDTYSYHKIWREMVFVPGEVQKHFSVEPSNDNVDGSRSRASNKVLKDLFIAVSGWSSQSDLLAIKELKDFFNRPWWTRIWVLQEITLSRNTYFICGTQRLPKARCDAFINMYHLLQAGIITGYYNYQPLNEYQRDILQLRFHERPLYLLTMPRIYRHRRCRLATLLCMTSVGSHYDIRYQLQNFDATKPEDRIFALLGLAADQEELKRYGVVPRYEIPYQQTYAITMAALLQQGHMFLLSMCQPPRSPGLPSWVPDWSQPIIHTFQEPHDEYNTMDPIFHCSGNRTYKNSTIKMLNDHGAVRRISIKSHLYDEIYQVGSFTNRGDHDHALYMQACTWSVDWLLEILRLSYCARKDYKGFYNRLRAGTRTCIGDVQWDSCGDRQRVGDDRVSDAILLLQLGIHLVGKGRFRIDACRFLKSQTRNFQYSEDGVEYQDLLVRDIVKRSPGRLPFVTSKGHLGLSFQEIMPGDVIAIIEGSQVPFVLRRQGKGQFILIGEAYVDGIMDGEAAGTGDFNYVTLV